MAVMGLHDLERSSDTSLDLAGLLLSGSLGL
jgi:hypothetical protein